MGQKSGKRGRDGVLSVEIDPLLLEGGRSVREMAEFLHEKLGGAYTVPVLINNIRSRMFVFIGKDGKSGKGYTLEKSDGRKIKLLPPTPATPETSETPITA